MKTLLLTAFLSLRLLFQCQSQHLQRKPFLGVMLAAVTDSLAKVNKLKDTDGAHVRTVIPGSTAAALQVQDQDVIRKVNGTAIKDYREVVTMARNFKTGQEVTLMLVRKGKTVTAKGKVQPMPFEPAPNAEIQYDEVPLGGDAYARSIIKKPKGKGKFPAVFFIQGFSCATVDNLPERDSQRQLIDGLVEKGFAVYRMEKPGLGDSKGPKPCTEIGYNEEAAAFAAGLKELKKYEFVDKENVFLFGHSLGGHTAPLIAAKDKVKGIITYGAAAKAWGEYMIDVSRYQRPITGTDYATADAEMKTMLPLVYEYLWLKKTPEQLSENSKYRPMLQERLGYDGKGHFFGRHYTFMQELHEVPLNQSWKEANAWTLAIYGEADVQAINANGVKLTADVVNSFHPGKASFEVLPKTDHGFIEVGTQQDYIKKQEAGTYNAYADAHFNRKLVDLLDTWMKDKLKKA
jgi:pimeloyl-ACP methyl ester carboxylesterase